MGELPGAGVAVNSALMLLWLVAVMGLGSAGRGSSLGASDAGNSSRLAALLRGFSKGVK